MTKPTSEQGFLSAEELLQFKLQQVWRLVDLPTGKRAIGTKWVFRNKKDDREIVIRNKARLFLAYASFMGFLVYQMDVKSVFLYLTIEEEVYVTQPLGFKNPNHRQSLQGGQGTLWVALSTKSMQKKDIIFISQDKYMDEILRKFNYTHVKSAFTPVDLEKPLVKHGDAPDVDEHLYRSMIGSLMYLTTSRLDIMFAVCACARFQVTSKTSHLLAVKRIFRYLKGKPTLGLWYYRDSPFELVAYTNSDYARETQDRKSTTRDLLTKGFDAGSNCLRRLLMSIAVKHGLKGHCNTKVVYKKKSKKHLWQSKRGRDTKIPQSSGPSVKVGDEAVHKELGDKMERAATTASSLEAE
ncbi:putative ribonuclease H-like domain-containing protein [Tanacetum coccineum]